MDIDVEIVLVVEFVKEVGAYDVVECIYWVDGGIDIEIFFCGFIY